MPWQTKYFDMIRWGAAVAELFSCWLAEQGAWGSNPSLATLISEIVTYASKSQYDQGSHSPWKRIGLEYSFNNSLKIKLPLKSTRIYVIFLEFLILYFIWKFELIPTEAGNNGIRYCLYLVVKCVNCSKFSWLALFTNIFSLNNINQFSFITYSSLYRSAFFGNFNFHASPTRISKNCFSWQLLTYIFEITVINTCIYLLLFWHSY